MTKATTLFALPNFIRGMSSILDIGGTLTIYNTSESPELADYKAICSDWAAVGDDISYAVIMWENERGK